MRISRGFECGYRLPKLHFITWSSNLETLIWDHGQIIFSVDHNFHQLHELGHAMLNSE